MNQDKKFHALVSEKGVDTAVNEYYPNLSPGQKEAVLRHANELVAEGKIG